MALYYYFRMKFASHDDVKLLSCCSKEKKQTICILRKKGREGGREGGEGGSKAPPSSHLFESDKWHSGCNFLFTSTYDFLTKIVFMVCGDCGQLLLLWTKCSEKCFLLCCWKIHGMVKGAAHAKQLTVHTFTYDDH